MTYSWTDEAQKAIDLCRTWAQRVAADVPSQIFLFGSAIYRGGDQFYSDQSDLDIVVLFKNPLDTRERINALKALFDHKANLELNMIPKLQRTSCNEPGVSIVPITQFELQANVHKSGARRFFTRNVYFDLLNEKQTLGIEGAGTLSIDDDHRYALEYVQKIRNEFLSVSANGTGGLRDYAGSDPMPKALLRVAAQQLKDVPVGAWYDTRLGLEDIYRKLGNLQETDSLFKDTYKTVSIRRGGRGKPASLSALDQLVLAEILFDGKSGTQTSRIVTWTLRLIGASFSEQDAQKKFGLLAKFAPGVELLGTQQGSIILEVRSDLNAYENVRRLHELDVLHIILEVERCDLGEARDLNSPIETVHDRQDIESRLMTNIAKFKIHETLPDEFVQHEFVAYLNGLRKSGELPEIEIDEDIYVEGPTPHFIDVAVQWVDNDGIWDTLHIELASISGASQFFRELDRLLALNTHIVLVCVAKQEIQRQLEHDVLRLSNETRKIKIIFVNPIKSEKKSEK